MPENVVYFIPNHSKQNSSIYEKFIDTIIQDLVNRESIISRSSHVTGCKIIDFEGKFITLLDQAYKSYLLGMYYTTVCLCTMANERLCYDLIDKSEIKFNEKILDPINKQPLYKIPFVSLVEFCAEIGLIQKDISKKMKKLNDLRNNYLHPTFKMDPKDDNKPKIDPKEDAKDSINMLIDIINKTLP